MKREKKIELFLAIFALAAVIIVALIIFIILKEGIKTFYQVNFFKFLFGKIWRPTGSPPLLGILPLLLGSVYVTGLALLLAVPIAVGSALFISEIASRKQRDILKPVIELLAGIPSVIYGFLGLVFIAPLFQKIFGLASGLNIFTTSFILAIMALPTIASVSEDAINAVPHTIKYASYSLGADKWETMTKVTLPAARIGIIVSIALGFGRVIGETMTVLMVLGGAAVIPHSIFSSAQTMTGAIASEMGEASYGSLHYHSLFAVASVLMVITLLFNIFAEIISSKLRQRRK